MRRPRKGRARRPEMVGPPGDSMPAGEKSYRVVQSSWDGEDEPV